MGLMKHTSTSGGREGISIVPKEMFFDRRRVQRAMDDATNIALREAAQRIRRLAQTSMRYVTSTAQQRRLIREGKRKRLTPYTPSSPGQPPRAVRPRPWVRKFLYYSYNARIHNAVIGPAGFPAGSDAPHTLEFGGRVKIRNVRRTIRRLGDSGEIRVGWSGGSTTHAVSDARGITQMVSYALLRTQAQVSRANRLQEQLYGALERAVAVAPRPFMGPAMLAEAPRMARLWAIRSTA
ncbi:MAG TPA: hypothetical protein VMY35_02815 [Phycisphaerae bacterium]|nr:hypothetical protein [Phycisphaerae bacterium]